MSNKITDESTIIKIMSIILLLLAIFSMPYWYYQLLKIIMFVSFSYLSFIEFRKKVQLFPFIFLLLAIIFLPLLNLKLGRTGWNIVDIFAALTLIYSILDNKYFRRFHE